MSKEEIKDIDFDDEMATILDVEILDDYGADTFMFSNFFSNNLFLINEYKLLYNYLMDKECYNIFMKKNIRHIGPKMDLKRILKNQELLKDALREDMDNMINLLNNQMIVYLETILETALPDCFISIFVTNPKLILQTEDCQNVTGASFKDLLNYESKEQYIIEVAKRVTDKYWNSGKMKKRLERIENILSFKLPDDCKKKMEELYDKRNEIVHENSISEISMPVLHVYSDQLEVLLKGIATALKGKGVKVCDNGLILTNE